MLRAKPHLTAAAMNLLTSAGSSPLPLCSQVRQVRAVAGDGGRPRRLLGIHHPAGLRCAEGGSVRAHGRALASRLAWPARVGSMHAWSSQAAT